MWMMLRRLGHGRIGYSTAPESDLFPMISDFSRGKVANLPPNPSKYDELSRKEESADDADQAQTVHDKWFKVNYYLRPNSMFGLYMPRNVQEKMFENVEKRNILRVLPRNLMWVGNCKNLPSSPASRHQNKSDQSILCRATEEVATEPAGEATRIIDSIVTNQEATRILIKCLKNNIFIVVSDPAGLPLRHFTVGMLGFKNSMKVTAKSALAMMDALLQYLQSQKIVKVRLEFRGVNTARQTILAQFRRNGLHICHVVDTTPIPFNGPRPKKARRL